MAPIGSSREGSKIIFSMLMDVGILLGEMVLVRRSDYHQTCEFGRQNGAATVNWQRPVLLRPIDHAFRNFFDFEDTARTWYVRRTGTPHRTLNDWGRAVREWISDDHEVAWREQAKGSLL